MKKFYDKKNKRIVFTKSKPTKEYWENHWNNNFNVNDVLNYKNRFITKITRKYLKEGSKILEGGCGIGDKVYALKKSNYDVVGVDFAKKIIEDVKSKYKFLDLIVGDIRNLPFANNTFDGYWSIGVIEHFYYGYDDIIKEMQRVIRNKGILFLTTPVISPLRNKEIKSNKYKEWHENSDDKENFYQFAFHKNDVIKNFRRLGFRLISYQPYDGLKGFKDSLISSRFLFQYIYDSNNLVIKIIRFILELILVRYSHHMMLFVFKK